MVPWRTRLVSLPPRGWNWVARFWGPNLAMAVLVALVAFGFTGIWGRLAAALGFAALYLVLVFVGGCVFAIFRNRDYMVNITRPDTRIHFDLNGRPGMTWEPRMGRCSVKDPNGVVTVSTLKAVGGFFWV